MRHRGTQATRVHSRALFRHLEHRHGLHQLLRQGLRALGSGCAFFHECGVLLSGLVHLADGVGDLLDA